MTADQCSRANARHATMAFASAPTLAACPRAVRRAMPPEPDPSRPTTKCDRNTLTGRAPIRRSVSSEALSAARPWQRRFTVFCAELSTKIYYGYLVGSLGG
jgi:hypothetical protein